MNKNVLPWIDYKKIFLKSITFAVVVLIVWYFLFFKSFQRSPEDGEVMSAVVGGFLVFSALLPSFTVSRLSQQFDELTFALADEDFKLFRKIYKKTVHPLTYLAIIVVSLLAIIALMMLSYNRIEVGMFSVGGLSFVHCFFYFITKELDSPKCWRLAIPPEWVKALNEN